MTRPRHAKQVPWCGSWQLTGGQSSMRCSPRCTPTHGAPAGHGGGLRSGTRRGGSGGMGAHRRGDDAMACRQRRWRCGGELCRLQRLRRVENRGSSPDSLLEWTPGLGHGQNEREGSPFIVAQRVGAMRACTRRERLVMARCDGRASVHSRGAKAQ
jgi:hypothetical protein